MEKFKILETESLRAALKCIESNHLGVVFTVNDAGVVTGIATDGDIRRKLLENASLDMPIKTAANPNFFWANQGTSREELLKKLDWLISKKDLEKNNKKKKKLNDIILKLRRKIQNIQTDTHYKIANFYCDNYDNVVIPQFGSKEMVKKQNRVINSKVVRKMNTISHGKLLQKLKTKAEEKNTKVIIQEESYTTKTCGNCNFLQDDIGGKRKWTCSSCNFTHDRDINAARNILRKYLKTFLQDTAIQDIVCSCYTLFSFCYIL